MTGSFMSKDKKRVIKAAPKGIYALSKFALMNFALSFQRHLSSFKRPDGLPPCTRVLVVDPGHTRTPGTRRWMTGGSLWGLLLYLITWPFWCLVLKSPQQGAQSILYAAMEEEYGRGVGGWFIKECREMDLARTDVRDEDVGKRLWEFSEKQIEEAEKESAMKRAVEKKETEARRRKKLGRKLRRGRRRLLGPDGARRLNKWEKMVIGCMHVTGVDYGDYFAYIDFLREHNWPFFSFKCSRGSAQSDRNACLDIRI